MMLRKFIFAPLAALAAFGSAAAMAHDGVHTAPTFANGLVHPFSGFDHIALLALSGLAVGFMIKRGWRPDKGAWLSLAGLFTLSAAMIGYQPYGVVLSVMVLCSGLYLSWKARIQSDGSNVTLMAATAIVLQLLSHFLARGDVQPNGNFAFGFAIGSGLIICAVLSAAVVVSRIVRSDVRR